MVDEPDEKHLQGEKKKPTKAPPTTTNHNNHHQHHPTDLGLTTQEALKVLCDEIDEVVKLYERNLHSER